ncbi:MAG: hypothetical protein NTZ17_05345 [Phycisphaerae bacterium]|nr:hypothetical protein [Phycisphaerae bacterium]
MTRKPDESEKQVGREAGGKGDTREEGSSHVLPFVAAPLHGQGATSCFLDKLSKGICYKSLEVNELENPQIAQIVADSRGKGEGESEREGGLTLAVVSPISLLPFL